MTKAGNTSRGRENKFTQLRKRILRQLLLRLLPFGVVILLKMLRQTLETEIQGERPSGSLLAIWHTNVLLSPIFHENLGITVLVSRSFDGSLVAKIVQAFGNFIIRGSSQKKGAAALRQMIRRLRRGDACAITPDGPRGPAFKAQEGIVIAASLSGRPIVPFHYEATKQWVIEKAWDKQRIPKPFSKVVLSYGPPIYVPRQLDAADLASKVSEVQTAMVANMSSVQERVRQLS